MNKLNNTKMSKIQTYSSLLSIRNKLKKVQQLSWAINKIEQRYDMDTLTDIELVELIEVYENLIDELEIILVELKDGRKLRVGSNS